MNGEQRAYCQRIAQGFLILAVASSSFAFELDPLRTRPAVMTAGVNLPGDQGGAACTLEPGGGLRVAAPTAGVLRDMTLTQAVDLALCNNPQVRASWAAIKVQAAGIGEARAAYLPTISVGSNRVRDRVWYPGEPFPEPTVQTGNTRSASLAWRLLDFGGRAANAASASALLDSALASHDAALQKVLSGVIGAYFDAQTATATLVARQKIDALALQTLQATKRREARGAGTPSDTLQAITAQAKASLEQTRAQGSLQKSLSVLVYVLGINPAASSGLSLSANLAEPQAALDKDINSWLEQARSQHPAIVAARAQLTAAQKKVTAAQSEGLPTLDLTGNFYQNGRPSQGLPALKTRETLVGLAVNIPLFDGFGRLYKVRGAQASVEQREADLQDVELQILADVVKTQADAVSALGNLSASATLIAAAQDAVASVQRKFDKGAVDILEMLSTQSALSDAQQERIRCLAEWRSARLRLLAAVGILGRDGL